MLISIIIPIFNAEKHLERCLDSVLNQTYSNLEIILVNDGSVDKSLEICEKYTSIDSRFVLINQSNKGPSGARNSALKIAKGDYVGFVDADDFVDLNMYSELIDIITKFEQDIIISNIKVHNKQNSYNILRSDIPYNLLLDKNKIKKHILKAYYSGDIGIFSSTVNKLYKKTFLNNNNLFFDEGRIRAEDYWFNFYAYKYANTVYVINEAYYHYINNENSIMKSFRENQFELFLKTKRELIENNNEFKFEINFKKFDKEFIDNCNEFILLAIKNKKKHVAYKVIKNEEFKKCFQNINVGNLHNKIIKKMLKYNLYYSTFLVYYLWSFKFKK